VWIVGLRRSAHCLAQAGPAPPSTETLILLDRREAMKRPVLTLMTLALLLISTRLDAATPPRSGVTAVFLSTNFRRLDRFEQLPEPIRNNLLSHFGKEWKGLKSPIADPKEPFNSGDAVDVRYPMRRLVFAGASDTLWFAYYEHGGIAFHDHLVIYQRGVTEPVFSGTFVPTRGGRYREPPATIDELKQWFTAGDIVGDSSQNHDW
jgi:hypothetical protein